MRKDGGQPNPLSSDAMTKSLLDTDILSEYLKGHDRTVATHAARYAQQHGIFSFTSVTVYEIVYGFEVKAASAQLKKALAWLGQNEQITPVNADYLAAATIKATARKQGIALELPDCLIAAVAARLDWPLVTGNTEDFQAIQKTGIKLTIENWREP
jgi:predicted nucleic acid-binding protein